jgi:predicted nucleic acid-binding protein
MNPSVYIETSIIGYLTSRFSSSLLTAANQQLTREWWEKNRGQFRLYISRYVIDECAAGDDAAAAERMEAIREIPELELSDSVSVLATTLIEHVPLPENAEVDALHIATAAVHGIEYLLTWNCRHIANASLRPRIESVCRDTGFEPPIICTPQELLEIWPRSTIPSSTKFAAIAESTRRDSTTILAPWLRMPNAGSKLTAEKWCDFRHDPRNSILRRGCSDSPNVIANRKKWRIFSRQTSYA